MEFFFLQINWWIGSEYWIGRPLKCFRIKQIEITIEFNFALNFVQKAAFIVCLSVLVSIDNAKQNESKILSFVELFFCYQFKRKTNFVVIQTIEQFQSNYECMQMFRLPNVKCFLWFQSRNVDFKSFLHIFYWKNARKKRMLSTKGHFFCFTFGFGFHSISSFQFTHESREHFNKWNTRFRYFPLQFSALCTIYTHAASCMCDGKREHII